jgi:hypothetical protein
LPWGRVQQLGAVALVVLSAAFFAQRCATSPEIPFIRQDADAPWVMPPVAVSAMLHQWGRADAPITSYVRGIHVPNPAVGHVKLELRAYRGFAVFLNDVPIRGGEDDGAHWRVARTLELAPLHEGWNELRIDIANAHGPALLSLRIEGLSQPVVSGPSFAVVHDGRRLGAAIAADDTRRNPVARSVETPLAALAKQRDATLMFFVAGIAAFFVCRSRFAAGFPAILPLAAFAIAAAWCVLFFQKFVGIPLEVGFDARHHGLYVDFLRTHVAVPLATDGWSMYHPPLFYGLAAVLQWLGEAVAGGAGGIAGMKALPFVSGVANVWIAFALCRKLFPQDSNSQYLTAVFAAVLPMNLYSAAYFSNETFHTLLAGIALLIATDLLTARASTAKRVALLGVVLGLALLTKFTAVLVTAVVAFFMACKLVAVERAGPARVAALFAAFAIPPLVIAGWFYARNLLVFGDPLIANWGNLPGELQKWWQQPGFHTTAWYLDFGESLTYPYLSAFHSYWDSLYSTLWGDGGIAGRVNPSQRHESWNYDFMSAGYLLALPASGFVLAGAVRGVARALGDPDPGRRAVFSLLATVVYAVLFGLTFMSLRLPYFAQAKASYGLVVMPILALYFSDGFRWLDGALTRRGWQAARAVAYGWFGAFAATCFLAFAA